MEFTVDRSKWLHGEGSGKSWLLRPSDGKMCCLGFRAIQSGAKEEDILKISSPGEAIDAGKPIQWDNLIDSNGFHVSECKEIMYTNDTKSIEDDAAREAQLVALFAKVGDTVRFTGEY